MSVAAALGATWRAKATIGRNALGRAWSHSSLRVVGMASFALALGAATFVLFRAAFAFVNGIEVLGPVLLVRLLSLFFFVLFVMLVMSNVLVAFQTLYRSREAEFWALVPLPSRTVFDARSLEIGLISSWAFLVLGTPLLLAFGVGTGARPAFYFLLPVVLLLFASIAHHVGAAATIALVRAFPGIDFKRLVLVIVVGLAPVLLALVRAFRIAEVDPRADGTELLVQALEGLGRTQYPLLPGYWAAEALRAASSGVAFRAAFLTWALAITALLAALLARSLASAQLLSGYQLLRGVGLARPVGRRERRRKGRPARGPMRALAAKDVALFFREPAQWSQVALVTVLATVYVANLRNLPDLARFDLWGHVAAHLNLGVTLLLVATLTTRFAFPLLSMEGRRAWIVLLAPLPRTALVRQKMLLALPVALLFGTVAAAFSTRVLGVAGSVILVSHVAVVAAAWALSGLAVGLGALFPNFREDNPARIVSGFGGTLNFLVGMTYCGLVTLLLGAPSVGAALGRIERASLERWEQAALVVVVVLSVAVGLVPLVLGRRRLRRLEL